MKTNQNTKREKKDKTGKEKDQKIYIYIYKRKITEKNKIHGNA